MFFHPEGSMINFEMLDGWDSYDSLVADPPTALAVTAEGASCAATAVPSDSVSSVRHMRPRNEVVDLDSRSVLPSGLSGLVVGFRPRGLVR